ncbi:hypothetical protein C0991_009267, partial [Blastosporella zonata]
MSSRAPVSRITCRCSQCSKTPEGFRYQTKSTIRKHKKNDEQCARLAQLTEPSNDVDDSENEQENILEPSEPVLIHEVEGAVEEFEGRDALALMDVVNPVQSDADLPPVPTSQPELPDRPLPPVLRRQEAETFVPAGPEPDPDPWVDDEDGEFQPLRIPAMEEEPYIRLAYLNAVYGNVYGKESWETATLHLQNQLNVLDLAGRLPIHPRPARSL